MHPTSIKLPWSKTQIPLFSTAKLLPLGGPDVSRTGWAQALMIGPQDSQCDPLLSEWEHHGQQNDWELFPKDPCMEYLPTLGLF